MLGRPDLFWRVGRNGGVDLGEERRLKEERRAAGRSEVKGKLHCSYAW